MNRSRSASEPVGVELGPDQLASPVAASITTAGWSASKRGACRSGGRGRWRRRRPGCRGPGPCVDRRAGAEAVVAVVLGGSIGLPAMFLRHREDLKPGGGRSGSRRRDREVVVGPRQQADAGVEEVAARGRRRSRRAREGAAPAGPAATGAAAARSCPRARRSSSRASLQEPARLVPPRAHRDPLAHLRSASIERAPAGGQLQPYGPTPRGA